MSAESQELDLKGNADPKIWHTHDAKKALLNKYTDKGAHLVLFEVQDTVGTSGTQYCDAVVIGNWASTGREIWGMEIKASRADWLRELKKADKSDRFTSQCDRWWLITTSRDIVKDGELPLDWGWMNMTKGGGLRVERQAPKLPHASETTVRRGWAYALMRRAYEKTDDDRRRALTMQREELEARHKIRLESEVNRARMKDEGPFEALKKKVEEFEKVSGIKLDDWRFGHAGEYCRLMNEAWSWRDREAFIRDLTESAKALTNLSAALGSLPATTSAKPGVT
jgi:hypothetical protein